MAMPYGSVPVYGAPVPMYPAQQPGYVVPGHGAPIAPVYGHPPQYGVPNGMPMQGAQPVYAAPGVASMPMAPYGVQQVPVQYAGYPGGVASVPCAGYCPPQAGFVPQALQQTTGRTVRVIDQSFTSRQTVPASNMIRLQRFAEDSEQQAFVGAAAGRAVAAPTIEQQAQNVASPQDTMAQQQQPPAAQGGSQPEPSAFSPAPTTPAPTNTQPMDEKSFY